MKLLVISDLHGRIERAEEAIHRHRDADAVLFLGDGARDLVRLSVDQPNHCPIGVCGNCDVFSLFGMSEGDFPEERLLRFGDFKILMMHGHRHGVKHGTDSAIAYAASRDADILLYGHTHIPEERYLPAGRQIGGVVLERPLWVMNPGSLGAPRDGKPTYGLVQLQGASVLLSHGTV